MELIPIKETLEENPEFVNDPDCQETLYMTIDFYKKVGFNPPWIGYYVKRENQLVGMAAFKGKPRDQKVEIAYGTLLPFRQKGIGTRICQLLVNLSLKTDPSVKITARTLPEKNYSTRILTKNGFLLSGTIHDEEDGEVWEWNYENEI
jgi:ribosomal-protein-alanine N-acetyltransferase